jgi:hypothetical protein
LKANNGSFGEMTDTIQNAEIKAGKVLVYGFEQKPIKIYKNGTLASEAEYNICAYNSITKTILFSSYEGKIEKFDLKQALAATVQLGDSKVANTDMFDKIKAGEKKNAPKSVYKKEAGTTIEVPGEYDEKIVKKLYADVNDCLDDIIGAWILNFRSKLNGRNLSCYVIHEDNSCEIIPNRLNYDIGENNIDAVVLLETTKKRFITIPVCLQCKELIESFDYKDITVAKFQDFLDFLAEENEDLSLEDEKSISQMLGGDITMIKIDNVDSVTYYIYNGKLSCDDEHLDATITAQVKERGKTKEYKVEYFPWCSA